MAKKKLVRYGRVAHYTFRYVGRYLYSDTNLMYFFILAYSHELFIIKVKHGLFISPKNIFLIILGGIALLHLILINRTLMNQEIYERLKKISERLKKEYNAWKVILFGSYARGEETEDSDVDLLVIAQTNERLFERMATVLEIIHDLYNGLPLSPIVLNFEEIEERLKLGDQFIQQILEKGIEL